MRVLARSSMSLNDLDQVTSALELLPASAVTDALLSIVDELRLGDATLFTEFDELTPSQAAPLLGISRPMVYRLVDRGELSARVVGRRDRRIPMASIKRYLERQASRVGAADAA